MSSARKNPITGGWVIMAQEQAMREPQYEPVRVDPLPPGEICPFCPGRESLTPEAIVTGPEAGGQPWSYRVIPNKFPTLSSHETLNRIGDGIYDLMSGVGAHEVLIETPEHTHALSDYTDEHLLTLVGVILDRSLALGEDPRFRSVQVFRNYGRGSGASIDHPHTQIFALPMVPRQVQEELEQAGQHFDYKERCLFCDVIDQETRDGERIIAENHDFVLFVPFAARFPFEMWIIPKVHAHDFATVDRDALRPLADLLGKAVRALRLSLNNPPFNLFLHSAPRVNKEPLIQRNRQCYHWHMEIIPRLTPMTGFEWATGIFVNPTLPEQAAAFLRRRLHEAEAG